MRKALRHLLVAALVLALTSPGLGYRDLWQDEVETAERARTILESGYPRVVDRSGALSLNTGGWELEDGDAHRYSPWVQFYWAAAGLAPARLAGASPDAGVRAPFVVAHAATSGLVSLGLEVAGLSPIAAAGVAVALGVQTVRVVHARTARYHALLDLWVAVGLLGVGLLARRRKAGLALVALSILVLPHVQTLAGSAFALTIGVVALVRLLQLSPGHRRAALGTAAASVALPGLCSLALLLALTRPWLHMGWTTSPPPKPSLKDLVAVAYALYFGLAAVAVLAWRRRRGQAVALGAALGTVVLVVGVLDLHPFSQTRYYLAAVFFGLLWPVYGGLEGWSVRERRIVAAVLALVVLLPDLAFAPARRDGFQPFQGVRLAWADAVSAGEVRQPLRRALDLVREHGASGDPVLVDYVPQFANWYLPGHPIALMPEPFARTPLNVGHPAWTRTPPMPRWHVWYVNVPPGPWICAGRCDYTVSGWNPVEGSYLLSSRRLGVSQKMCIVALYPTEKWLNAPFRMSSRAAFRPEGTAEDVLAVAVPCGARPERSDR